MWNYIKNYLFNLLISNKYNLNLIQKQQKKYIQNKPIAIFIHKKLMSFSLLN